MTRPTAKAPSVTPPAPAEQLRPLKETDLPQLFAIRQLAFLDRSDFSDPEVRERHLSRLAHSYGHFSGQTLTSAAVMHPFEMYLAGVRVRMGGLAGVLSAPEHRRRGFVAKLLFGVLQALRAAGTGWCLEYPFDPRFYARYGFASVPTGAEVSVPAERLYRSRAPDGARRVDGASSLKPLYEHWAAGHNFTLVRSDRVRNAQARPDWERIAGGEARFSYLLEDAYCVLELTANPEGQTLNVHDYAYTTPAGYDALWRFIGSFHGQVQRIELQLSADDPLLFDLQRYHTAQLPLLQARVVDVELALSALASPSTAAFALRLEDDFCEWNHGSFGLELSPSGTQVRRTDAAPDLTLDVRTLALLLSGALNADAAKRTGLVKGSLEATRTLAALAGGRQPFMPRSDYF